MSSLFSVPTPVCGAKNESFPTTSSQSRNLSTSPDFGVIFGRLHIGPRGCFIEADLAVCNQSGRRIRPLLLPIGCVPHFAPLHNSSSLVAAWLENGRAIKSSMASCQSHPPTFASHSNDSLNVVSQHCNIILLQCCHLFPLQAVPQTS